MKHVMLMCAVALLAGCASVNLAKEEKEIKAGKYVWGQTHREAIRRVWGDPDDQQVILMAEGVPLMTWTYTRQDWSNWFQFTVDQGMLEFGAPDDGDWILVGWGGDIPGLSRPPEPLAPEPEPEAPEPEPAPPEEG